MTTTSLPWGAPIKEVTLIGLAAVALFLLLAIFSYSPNDSAWSYRGNDAEIHNIVGAVGAWLADIMLSLFGLCAYLIPLSLVIAGVHVFRHGSGTWASVGVRTSGWAATVLSLCVLARLHVSLQVALPAGPGGMIGDWLVGVGLPMLNWVGLTLAAVVGVLLGSQAGLHFSWIDAAEATGRFVYRSTSRVLALLDAWRDRFEDKRRRDQRTESRREKRHAAVEAEVKRRETRKAPEIAIPRSVPAPVAPEQAEMFEFSGGDGELPDVALLDDRTDDARVGFSEQSLEGMSRLLELKLKDFGVDAEVVSVFPGPVVTRFEIQPAPGTKVSRISALVKDLARSLAVVSVRIVEVIPGKSVVGIEVPNEHRAVVRLKDLLTSDAYRNSRSPLTLALGKDIAGEPVIADITRMPHLLVAGTTGSGKSVGVNAMLLSLLYKAAPDEVRLILIDPKMLELAVYEGVPHLLAPVVTDMKEAAQALRWCVAEMERRYRVMAALGVRNLAGYNRKVQEALERGRALRDPTWPAELAHEAPELTPLPFIVVVIDEFADMMMIVGKKVEQLIARIAQKARAAGIHLVLATQRPSVDVITGLIKANIPTRISFQVSSKIDSRTILDQGGAEQLLGHGDMLFLPPGTAVPTRVHGAFVSDEEVHRVVADWKKRATPQYHLEITNAEEPLDIPLGLDSGGTGSAEQDDELYDEAVAFVLETRRASISAVQRKLRIGYNRAARLIEAMEAAGVVSEMNTNGAREVLVNRGD